VDREAGVSVHLYEFVSCVCSCMES